MNTFPTTATASQDGGSPSPSVASQKSEANKKSAPGAQVMKTLHAEQSPRSRSSDDVAKFSPLVGRRSHGDSPLTASPLARRNTVDSSRSSIDKDGAVEDAPGQPSTPGSENNKEQQYSDTSENSGKSVMSSVRKFSGANHGHTSPTNGSVAKKNYILETAKSPVLRSLTTKNNQQQHGDRRSPPTTAPKPRPWSMATDRKSGK